MFTGFVSELWHQGKHHFLSIIQSRFIKRIGEGSLPSPTFFNFLRQDLHYLVRFCGVLDHILSKIKERRYQVVFKKIKQDTEIEIENIKRILDEALISQTDTLIWQRYSDHLRNTAENEVVGVSVASLLPCFLFFHQLGLHFREIHVGTMHPYRKWIERCAPEELHEVVLSVGSIVNFYAENAVNETRERMKAAFLISASCEAQLFSEADAQIEQQPRLSLDEAGAYVSTRR